MRGGLWAGGRAESARPVTQYLATLPFGEGGGPVPMGISLMDAGVLLLGGPVRTGCAVARATEVIRASAARGAALNRSGRSRCGM